MERVWEGKEKQKKRGGGEEREVWLLPDKYNAINSELPLQGRILATSKIGFFPSDAVRPCPCVSVNLFHNQYDALSVITIHSGDNGCY